MSSKKVFETTTKVDKENTDSGFLSGELLSSELLSSECIEDEERRQTEIKDSKLVAEPVQQDSGLDLYLSECLSSASLSEVSQTTPRIEIEPAQKTLPLEILFQQDDDGDTQLHIAAVHGCEKSIATIIRVCQDKSWLDIPNDYGHTPLHLTAMSGHAVVTRMLVRAGANLAIRDLTGSTPLHLAAAAGYSECLQALLAPVPEHPPRKLATLISQKNYDGQTCVHMAATAGHIGALQTLVFYGADINLREGLCGWTALHIAAAHGNIKMAQFLLDKCPGVARDTGDYAGRTASRIAKRTAAATVFNFADDSETETDSEDDMMYEVEQSLFEKISEGMSAINVA